MFPRRDALTDFTYLPFRHQGALAPVVAVLQIGSRGIGIAAKFQLIAPYRCLHFQTGIADDDIDGIFSISCAVRLEYIRTVRGVFQCRRPIEGIDLLLFGNESIEIWVHIDRAILFHDYLEHGLIVISQYVVYVLQILAHSRHADADRCLLHFISKPRFLCLPRRTGLVQ